MPCPKALFWSSQAMKELDPLKPDVEINYMLHMALGGWPLPKRKAGV